MVESQFRKIFGTMKITNPYNILLKLSQFFIRRFKKESTIRIFVELQMDLNYIPTWRLYWLY